MGTPEIAAVASVGVIAAFVAGTVFAAVWPHFVAWMDRRFDAPKPKVNRHEKVESIGEATKNNLLHGDWPTLGTEQAEMPKAPLHRRRGIAELRHEAEMRSMGPVTHQQEVTAKNTRALEGQ